MADGDPQSRCQNCIRLNKECVFYPVDQQSGMDKPSGSSSSRATGTPTSSTAVSQSPQDLAAGRPFEQSGPFAVVPSLPSNAPRGFPLPYDQPTLAQTQGMAPSSAFSRVKLTEEQDLLATTIARHHLCVNGPGLTI